VTNISSSYVRGPQLQSVESREKTTLRDLNSHLFATIQFSWVRHCLSQQLRNWQSVLYRRSNKPKQIFSILSVTFQRSRQQLHVLFWGKGEPFQTSCDVAEGFSSWCPSLSSSDDDDDRDSPPSSSTSSKMISLSASEKTCRSTRFRPFPGVMRSLRFSWQNTQSASVYSVSLFSASILEKCFQCFCLLSE